MFALLAACTLLPVPDAPTPGGEDSALPGPPPPLVAPVASPCRSARVNALVALDDAHLYVGCDAGLGLWETMDSGVTWRAPLPADNAYGFTVNALLAVGAGVLACGVDPTVDPTVLLWDVQPDGAHVLLDAEAPPRADGARPTSCGALAAAGPTLFLLDGPGTTLLRSPDGGFTWGPPALALPPLRAFAVRAGGAVLAVAGAGNTAPELVALPAGPVRRIGSRPARPAALATLGAIRLVGGTADGRGWLARSRDDGRTWGNVPVPVRRVRALALAGPHGLLLGDRGLGGAVLRTEDAGATWAEVPGDWPSLDAVALTAGGAWLGGEGWLGFLPDR